MIYLRGFLIALCGAIMANAFNLPIPWLLGSLLCTAVFRLNGLNVAAPAWGRKIGLGIIGISLGLFVNSQMVQLILNHYALLIIAALFAIFLGVMGSVMVYRYGGVDFKTAWYASAVGGASEMANLAEQQGANVAQVVSAHSLRVLMVVTLVPFFYQFMGWHGFDDSILQTNGQFHFFGLFLLLLWAYGVARFFEWRKWSNPWTFGPLLAASILTICGIHLSSLPAFASPIGQLLIGWSLGNKFAPNFFRSAPRLLSVVAVSVIISLIFTALLSLVLAHTSSLPLPTLGLGFAPGGVAEMTITAKVLQLGVPIVTAFHIVRMITVVGCAGIIYRYIEQKWFKSI